MKLEQKIEMLGLCNMIAQSMEQPRHQGINMSAEYRMMIDDVAGRYDIEADKVLRHVKMEQLHITGLLPTQYKLELGDDSHKFYQEVV